VFSPATPPHETAVKEFAQNKRQTQARRQESGRYAPVARRLNGAVAAHAVTDNGSEGVAQTHKHRASFTENDSMPARVARHRGIGTLRAAAASRA